MDEVFTAVDRTRSTLGQHALYHRLRSSPVGRSLDAFDALVTRIMNEAPLRERAQVALTRLQDPDGYNLWWLGEEDALDARPWHAIFPIMTFATVSALAVGLLWFHFVPVLLATLGVSAAIRYATEHQIHSAAAVFRQLAPLIVTAQALAYVNAAEIDRLLGDWRAGLPQLRFLKAISRFVSRDPFMLSWDASPFARAVNDITNVAYEYLSLAFLLDGLAVFFGLRRLKASSKDLLRVVAAMGEIDAALAVASYRAGTEGWTRPHLVEQGAPLVLHDLRHPLLKNAVANSITLGPPHGVLVTGSNMSGKSTFLRTVGVSAVMAQTIDTCLASKYEAPVLRVRTCIGRSDDLLAGKSYYLAEVEALLGMVRASEGDGQYLFLLDELFRGTNAVERIAAGEAVLRELTEGKAHVTITATHDGELVSLLADAYTSSHLEDEVGPQGPVFHYRLQPGPATSRNAITLLQLNGAPDSLIARARGRAAALDQERLT